MEKYLYSSIILLNYEGLVGTRKDSQLCVHQNVHLDAFDLENITFDITVDCDEDGDDGGENIIRGLDIET